jgi:hypothetical protein
VLSEAVQRIDCLLIGCELFTKFAAVIQVSSGMRQFDFGFGKVWHPHTFELQAYNEIGDEEVGVASQAYSRSNLISLGT